MLLERVPAVYRFAVGGRQQYMQFRRKFHPKAS